MAVCVDDRSQRAASSTALILGFFGAAWFGWGQAAAPDGVRPWLAAGSVLAALAAASGIAVTVWNRSQPRRMNDPAARRRHGIIVGIEFGVAGLGAVVLGIAGTAEYIPVLICAVVGAHFVPLAPVLADHLLVPLGAATCAVAILALVLKLTSDVAPSTVTGIRWHAAHRLCARLAHRRAGSAAGGVRSKRETCALSWPDGVTPRFKRSDAILRRSSSEP